MKRLIVAVLWLGACGGGGETIPIDELEARATEVLCSFEVRCGVLPDPAACQHVSLESQLLADVKAGKVIYDGGAAAACLDFDNGLSCKVSEQKFSIVDHAPSCNETFKGTVAPGGSCLTDAECLSQTCHKSGCDGTTACCTGTCTAKVLAGGDCSASGAECAEGLFCRRNTTDQTAICTAPIPDGQPCTSGGDICVAGRRCILVTSTSAGTCGVLPARGQACPDNFCDSPADVCDPASKTCVARIAVGGDCAVISKGCVAYAKCDGATKTCVALKRAGEACAQATDCLFGLACTDGLCVAHTDDPVCP